ncbi:MAG: hypothetical protein Kow0062_26580 [Acidobacteriota bacterium]
MADHGQRPVGLVGHGRFGAALADLLEERGRQVVAFDPAAEVPSRRRADSLDELARAAGTILLAVPVPGIRPVLEALAPRLGPSHLVADLASVKTGPMAAMHELLGARVPWAGAHPLFGPTSLALGERPLRVVVCAAAEHPAAAHRVRALFQSFGCTVVERTPEEHDRQMAESHALTYFIAKAVLDGQFTFDPDLAPPSAQAIARAVEAVRADAGHLLLTLHRDNPFAGATRQRFLETLGQVDRELSSAADEPPAAGREQGAAPPALAIPDLGARSPQLRRVRELIDDLDRELVSLLARRAALARRARRAKDEIGGPVRDPVREQDLLAARRAWAGELGLDSESIDRIFAAILEFSRRVQGSGS